MISICGTKQQLRSLEFSELIQLVAELFRAKFGGVHAIEYESKHFPVARLTRRGSGAKSNTFIKRYDDDADINEKRLKQLVEYKRGVPLVNIVVVGGDISSQAQDYVRKVNFESERTDVSLYDEDSLIQLLQEEFSTCDITKNGYKISSEKNQITDSAEPDSQDVSSTALIAAIMYHIIGWIIVIIIGGIGIEILTVLGVGSTPTVGGLVAALGYIVVGVITAGIAANKESLRLGTCLLAIFYLLIGLNAIIEIL